jgi:hypothetical protein
LGTDTLTLGQLVDEHLQGREWATHISPAARNLSTTDADRKAAWDLYVELLTRIATQALDDEEGVEVTALESIAGLFPTARQVMRSHGREAAAFAAPVLALFNHRVRAFTAPWHKRRPKVVSPTRRWQDGFARNCARCRATSARLLQCSHAWRRFSRWVTIDMPAVNAPIPDPIDPVAPVEQGAAPQTAATRT